MKKLDRFLLARFFSLYLFIVLVFVVIFFIVDLVEHIDSFIDNGLSLKSVAIYYFYTFPFFIHIAIPMSALLAVVFHFGLMNKRYELTAMKSAGMSLYRIVVPFLLTGLAVSVFSFVFEDQVVVPANQILTEFRKENLQPTHVRRADIISNIDISIPDGNILHIDEYNTETQRGKGVGIQFLEKGRLVGRYDARSIFWRHDHWVVKQVEKRFFPEQHEEFSTLDSLSFAWKLQPEDLEKRKVSPDNMSFMQLLHFIKKLGASGLETTKWKVNLFFKTAMNFTTFIVILFGIPLVSYQSRGGNFASGVGISLFIIFIYTTILKFGETLGYAGQLSPFMSVWAPNFLFLFFGIILLLKAQK